MGYFGQRSAADLALVERRDLLVIAEWLETMAGKLRAQATPPEDAEDVAVKVASAAQAAGPLAPPTKARKQMGSARHYSHDSLSRFTERLEPVELEYYEYQDATREVRYEEWRGLIREAPGVWFRRKRAKGRPVKASHFGAVTWRRVPVDRASATQRGHCDGVLCGVWRKQSGR